MTEKLFFLAGRKSLQSACSELPQQRTGTLGADCPWGSRSPSSALGTMYLLNSVKDWSQTPKRPALAVTAQPPWEPGRHWARPRTSPPTPGQVGDGPCSAPHLFHQGSTHSCFPRTALCFLTFSFRRKDTKAPLPRVPENPPSIQHQFALSPSIDEALSFLGFCHVRQRRELPESI